MKKFLIFIVMCMMSIVLFAQEKDVTRFMGIPVDGTLSDFAQELINKGFKQAKAGDVSAWEGEFNGAQCTIHIVTTRNKVSRILVVPEIAYDEANIKIRFNALCNQFKNNPKYVSGKDYTLSYDENIGYEMLVNHKRFEASFYQLPPLNSGQELTDHDIECFAVEALKKPVWFMIVGDPLGYKILLYYDNEYNRPSGEDL